MGPIRFQRVSWEVLIQFIWIASSDLVFIESTKIPRVGHFVEEFPTAIPFEAFI